MKKTIAPEQHDPVVVGGVTPLTTIDYPGELAAVLFLQGCPWRCGYCHNQDLIPRQADTTIAWHEVIDFLSSRKGLLDAVVFSGGEPTLHSRLPEAMQQVKSMGFKIGLHTGGIYPHELMEALPFVDWVGMDIKSALEDYAGITGVKGSGERAWKSARVLLESGVAHEFRTTVHPDMLNAQQLRQLVAELQAIGAEHYVIQECQLGHCLDEAMQTQQTEKLPVSVLNMLGEHFPDFQIRGFE